MVQHKLGAEKAGCYDVNSACAGWVTALDQGARYLATEESFRYVLVAGGYGMSRYINPTDKKTANLFADYLDCNRSLPPLKNLRLDQHSRNMQG